ncbi:hypothetical protein ACOSQ4_021853 [Xanthoceras sorbifolium]
MSASFYYPLCFQSNFLFYITLVLLVPFASSTTTIITRYSTQNERDEIALRAFKSKIVHDPQGVLSSWNDSRHLCEWEGITCGRRHRRVTVLDLNSRGLSGSLSPYVGNLSFLKMLILHDNSIQGEIPRELGRLFRLKYLILTNNSLIGEIPANLSYCSRLVELNIGGNKLVGKVPPEFVSLHNLTMLVLHKNNLTGTIPHFLGNLTSLEVISIAFNAFGENIPDSLGRLRKLWFLGLSTNNLIGTVPLSLYNLSSLSIFSVSQNQLHGSLPSNLGLTLPNLQKIQISFNLFSGSIPISLSNASKLEHVDMSENNFSGKLSIDFGGMQHLVKLAINQLYGSIPPGIANIVSLKVLAIFQNQFTGTIPTEIGKLQNLHLMYLSDNQISGEIPVSLGNLSLLEELTLDNHLGGIIPDQIFNIPHLSISLSLAQNHLVGSIPQSIGNLKVLSEFDVAGNKLTEFVFVEGNFFHGSIPPSLSDLRGIRELDLSCNNLSGQIPKFLETLALEKLNLSFNNFEGKVPMKGIFTNASAVLGLILISSFIFCWLKKRGKEQASESVLEKSLLKVSYEMLLKATDGFSPTHLVGAGSFGSVYKGVLDQDGAIVAVKVLNLQQQAASKSFIAECKALRNIRHRNLVRVITSCSSIDFQGNDFKAIVYEFMANDSLEKWLHPALESEEEQNKEQTLTILQRISIAIDVASAIEYLHLHCQEPVFHCDLKPSNVLLDNDMTAHVGDFGLSRFRPKVSNPNQSSSVGVKGTIGYAAPEYGLGNEVSANGDVYSFGILLLEIVIGKKPTNLMFKGDFNLHSFARMALPDRVMDIVDPMLINEEMVATNHRMRQAFNDSREECLISMARIGVVCSMESPQDRMNISRVVHELQSARKLLVQPTAGFNVQRRQ